MIRSNRKHISNYKEGGTVHHTLLIVFLLMQGLAFAKKPPCPDASSLFLQACDGKLYLQGKEYRAVGVNFYTAFRLYLDRGWEYPKGRGKEFARKELEKLSARGIPIIRVMGLFSSNEFYEVFFDKHKRAQRAKRKEFFSALDAFLDDCNRLGIFVVYDLMWNMQNLADLGKHSLYESITNPKSPGNLQFEEFSRAVAARYKNRPGIIFGIGNEYNLKADLRVWLPQGVLEQTPLAEEQKLYRGPDNNFNSLELAAFFKRAIAGVKRAAPKHLVVTGNAEPRLEAMHLMRAALGSTDAIELDSLTEHEAAIVLLESSADMVSSHYYANEHIGAAWYRRVARRLGKPLFMGEVGPHVTKAGDTFIGADYTDPDVIKAMRKKSRELVDAGTAISLWWAYDCRDDGNMAFRLCYGKTDAMLAIIEESNRAAQNSGKNTQ